MSDSDNENDNNDESERMCMHRTNWRRRATSLSQIEISNVNEYFNNLTDYIGSMTSVLKTTVIIDRLLNYQDTYYDMLSQIKILCMRLIMILIQSCLLITNNIHQTIIHVRPNMHPFPALKNRFIDDLDEEWSRTNTRFTKLELRKIYTHLRIPEKFTVLRRGNILHGETVLLISLVYMAHAIPWYQMSEKFGGDPREFGSFFLLFTEHVYTTFYHHISGDSMRIYINRIDKYCHAIWKHLVSTAIAK